jgi:hypothetical protein
MFRKGGKAQRLVAEFPGDLWSVFVLHFREPCSVAMPQIQYERSHRVWTMQFVSLHHICAQAGKIEVGRWGVGKIWWMGQPSDWKFFQSFLGLLGILNFSIVHRSSLLQFHLSG